MILIGRLCHCADMSFTGWLRRDGAGFARECPEDCGGEEAGKATCWEVETSGKMQHVGTVPHICFIRLIILYFGKTLFLPQTRAT